VAQAGTDKHIHLGIAFDSNYLSPFYALAASILDNNRNTPLTIHAIVTGLEQPVLDQIRTYIRKEGKDILFYSIDEQMVSRFTLINKWTQAVYYRLLFPVIVPATVDRLLYIDTDTLVLNDLSALYNARLHNHPVGAVYDNYVVNHPEIGIEGTGNYFNSGVLLMDIGKWKEQQITEKAFDYLDRYPERIKFVDQDALNAVLKDNWEKLPFAYNVLYSYIPQTLSMKGLDNFIKDKVILHFTLQRPWSCISTNRFRKLYHHYLKKSPAPERRKYTDWSPDKIIPALRVRMLEMYFDLPLLQKAWRRFQPSKNIEHPLNV